MRPFPELLARPCASELIDRLVRYARIETTSDRHIEAIPSTPTQWNLARLLVEELKAMGIADVSLDDHCYLIARIPARAGYEGRPSIGLMAHMDTASDVSGTDVKPRIVVRYDGSVLSLGEGRFLDPKEFPDLSERVGDTIIVTDGTTLLGADDKAGLAEIMTAAGLLLSGTTPHGPIELIFTPDEETGKGMNLFPLAKLRSAACYTLDAGKAGEIEAECFTAYSVKAEFKGKVIHIGSARGKLANATAMAASFVTMLPRSEAPESTDGWYGYYCPLEISGGLERANVEVFLRDFTSEGMEKRIASVRAIAAAVEAQFPLGSVELTVTKQYVNMREKLDESPDVLARVMEAARRAGAEPFIKPIRGGTDGARLTEMGVPTPNVFTGGYNYHSRYEWASVSDMVLAVDTILELAGIWALG
ncbi:MAG: peptidase T [Spirochaetaceae bacterium]|nr:peptidase T [Spirochaetaceae bacterium]